MSSKVVEADAGIHSLAMAVAVRVRCRHGLMYNALTFCSQPVISWRLYGMVTSLFCHCQRITGLTLSLSLTSPPLDSDPMGTWGMVPPFL